MSPKLRLPLLIASFLTAAAAPALAQPATSIAAREAANAIEKWGLIGRWSPDCWVAPGQAPLLIYAKADDGSIVRFVARRIGTNSTNQILAAHTTPVGNLEITEEQDSKRIVTFVLSKDRNGGHRSISSQDAEGRIYIRDGKFTGNGAPAPLLERCD
jgi:hypothetical protein